nr:tetratricopeptide repeat protein [Methylobacterium sp. L1A1]
MRVILQAAVFAPLIIIPLSVSSLAEGSSAFICRKAAEIPWEMLEPENTINVCKPAVAGAGNDAALIYSMARALERKRLYSESGPLYLKAAELGYSAAQSKLSSAYEYGEGVPKDAQKSLHWAQKAADQSETYGFYRLALAYQYGRTVDIDMNKAIELYTKAARGGTSLVSHMSPAYKLADIYERGLGGIPKDKNKAVFWYTKAVSEGDSSAQRALGKMYDIGDGVPMDKNKARELFRLAAAQGDIWSKMELGQGTSTVRGGVDFRSLLIDFLINAVAKSATQKVDVDQYNEYRRNAEQQQADFDYDQCLFLLDTGYSVIPCIKRSVP